MNNLPFELAEELFPLALEFDLGPIPIINGKLTSDFPEICGFAGKYNVSLRYRGTTGWAIIESNTSCLSKSKNEFVYEPSPSNRDEKFIEDTRFKDAKEAIDFYNEWKRKELYEYETKTGKYERLKDVK